MTTLKAWILPFAIWLARWAGWEPLCTRLHADSPYLDTARLIYKEIERQHFHNGEQKRHHALTAMLNRHPEARERDLAFAIELAVREH